MGSGGAGNAPEGTSIPSSRETGSLANQTVHYFWGLMKQAQISQELLFTLPHVEILMPTKKPRGAELPLEQQRTNQALHHRRLRIEHVNSSVKRCRIVKDRIRLWKEGVRDLVMELCYTLHNFRMRLHSWLPMI
jgi:DDE superfamily endonuclease